MYIVKKVNYKDTYLVINQMLGVVNDVCSSGFAEKDESGSWHFAIFEEDDLIGAVSFFNRNNKNFNKNIVFELQGLTVLTSFQGRGAGMNLLMHAEAFLRKEQPVLVWCKVCEEIVPFYKKSGYNSKGDMFDIPGFGNHIIMYKLL